MFEKFFKAGCRLCPRNCGIDRNKFRGLCKTRNRLEIASFNIHCGEEPPISGLEGSGTIFFAGCNLSCIYCQNYPISQLKAAYKTISIEELAEIMLKLQERKAHNINLVTPSHFVHLIVEAIEIAKKKGLSIPIVYNTSSYDKVEVIRLLSDYVDIYLADLKYADDELAFEFSKVKNYVQTAKAALLEMYKTKGKLKTKNGIAYQGLIVRHLVLPGFVGNSKAVLKWIKESLPGVDVSVMFQYFPAFKAIDKPPLNRKISLEEYQEICDYLAELDLDGFIQQI
ncbi:radical SAM protein [Hippea jasoniae]|uniref:radical SAM protein n=1 Tax=Hippea jasoniae TaxID=944479 RepID=UPI000550997D|nr:radical SAM protein [Hippea jasoniae]